MHIVSGVSLTALLLILGHSILFRAFNQIEHMKPKSVLSNVNFVMHLLYIEELYSNSQVQCDMSFLTPFPGESPGISLWGARRR